MTVVCIGLQTRTGGKKIPVASLIDSSLILKKRPTKIQLVGIVITLAGVLITVFAAGVSASFSAVGYAFLTIAVVSYALYSVFVEKARIGVNRTSSFIGASTVVAISMEILIMPLKLKEYYKSMPESLCMMKEL